MTALVMAAVMLMTSLPVGFAYAGMVSTENLIKQRSDDSSATSLASSERDRIRDVLAREDVRHQMLSFGIDAAEADARLAALTDQEVADISGKLAQLPAGEGVGSILVIIFIVFGVAVLIDALGIFDIFPFVCGSGQCGQQQIQALTVEPAAGPTQLDPYAYDNQQRSYYRRDQFGGYDGRRQRNTFDYDPYAQQPLPPQRTRDFQTERQIR